MPPSHIPQPATVQEAPRKTDSEGGGVSQPSVTLQKSDRQLFDEVRKMEADAGRDYETIRNTSARLNGLLSQHSQGIFKGVDPPDASKTAKVSIFHQNIKRLKDTFEKRMGKGMQANWVQTYTSPSFRIQPDSESSNLVLYDEIAGNYSGYEDNFCKARDAAAGNLYEVSSSMLHRERRWLDSIKTYKANFTYNEDDHWSVNVARFLSTSGSTRDAIQKAESIYIWETRRPLKKGDDFLLEAVRVTDNINDDDVQLIETVHNKVIDDAQESIESGESTVKVLKTIHFIGGIPINVYAFLHGGAGASAGVAAAYSGLSTLAVSSMEESINNHYRPDDQKKSFADQTKTVLIKTAFSAALSAALDYCIGKFLASKPAEDLLKKIGEKTFAKIIQNASERVLQKAIQKFVGRTGEKAVQLTVEESMEKPLQNVSKQEMEEFVETNFQSSLREEVRSTIKEASENTVQGSEKSSLNDLSEKEIDEFLDDSFQSIVRNEVRSTPKEYVRQDMSQAGHKTLKGVAPMSYESFPKLIPTPHATVPGISAVHGKTLRGLPVVNPAQTLNNTLNQEVRHGMSQAGHKTLKGVAPMSYESFPKLIPTPHNASPYLEPVIPGKAAEKAAQSALEKTAAQSALEETAVQGSNTFMKLWSEEWGKKGLWNKLGTISSVDEIAIRTILTKIPAFAQLPVNSQQFIAKGLKTIMILLPTLVKSYKQRDNTQTADELPQYEENLLSSSIALLSAWVPTYQLSLFFSLMGDVIKTATTGSIDSDNDGIPDSSGIQSTVSSMLQTTVMSIIPGVVPATLDLFTVLTDTDSDSDSDTGPRISDDDDYPVKSYSEELAPVKVSILGNQPESTFESYDQSFYYAVQSTHSKNETELSFNVQMALFTFNSASNALKKEKRKTQHQIRKQIKNNNLSTIALQLEDIGSEYTGKSPDLAAMCYTLSSKLWSLNPSTEANSMQQDLKKASTDKKLALAIRSQIDTSSSKKTNSQIDNALVLAKASRKESDFARSIAFLKLAEKSIEKIHVNESGRQLSPKAAEVKANALATEAKRLYDQHIAFKDNYPDSVSYIHLSASFYELAAELLFTINPETSNRWRDRAIEYRKAD